MTRAEAADQLGVTQRTVRRMVRESIITASTDGSIPKSEVERLLRSRSDESVTAAEAARRLMVTSQWVRKMVKRGSLESLPKEPGTSLRIRITEIQRFAADNDMGIRE